MLMLTRQVLRYNLSNVSLILLLRFLILLDLFDNFPEFLLHLLRRSLQVCKVSLDPLGEFGSDFLHAVARRLPLLLEVSLQ